MRKDALGRGVRIAIWLVSFVTAGATKPLFFPQGGSRYFLAAAAVIVIGYFVGRWIEVKIIQT